MKYVLSKLTITSIMLVSGCEQQSIKAEAVRWNYTEFVRAVENNGVKQVIIEGDATDALDTRAVRAKVITSKVIKIYRTTLTTSVALAVPKIKDVPDSAIAAWVIAIIAGKELSYFTSLSFGRAIVSYLAHCH